MLLDTLCSEIRRRHVEGFAAPVVALQVKEKFGTLRFRIRGGDAFVRGMVAMASTVSGFICEDCGDPVSFVPEAPRSSCPTHPLRVRRETAPGLSSTALTRSLRVLDSVRNPRWRFIADALSAWLRTSDERLLYPPEVVFIEAVESEVLSLRVRDSDRSAEVAGMLRLVEAYSMRCE